MKKFLQYLYTSCAIIALIVLLYQMVPVFPYIRDKWIFLNMLALVLFYYLAQKNSNGKKENGLT